MASDNFGAPIKDMKGYMPESQVKVLIEKARVNSANYPRGFAVFLRLLWVTGARVSEILGDKSWYKGRVYQPVTVGDVDFEEGVIILSLLKRKVYPPPKHRVALDKRTLQNLKEYILTENIQGKQPLFNFSRGSAFYYLRKLGKDVHVEKVGSKKIHNHHFRHSHCVAYIKKNNTLEGLRKLQQRIGHANIGTTAHYLQFGPEQRKETEEVFGNW